MVLCAIVFHTPGVEIYQYMPLKQTKFIGGQPQENKLTAPSLIPF